MTKCNICNGHEFDPGPDGRLSIGGLPPRCRRCGSLERHRVMRAALDAAGERQLFRSYRLIRFSDDPIVEDGWFVAAEVSRFEGDNSLDLQAIDRADGDYDIVVCSHVLEHVADDARALRELVRIMSAEGFAMLAVPRVETGNATDDWGFADPDKNLHYRGYGRDFDSRLKSLLPSVHVIPVERPDPVTGDRKRFHVLTRSGFWAERFRQLAAHNSRPAHADTSP